MKLLHLRPLVDKIWSSSFHRQIFYTSFCCLLQLLLPSIMVSPETYSLFRKPYRLLFDNIHVAGKRKEKKLFQLFCSRFEIASAPASSSHWSSQKLASWEETKERKINQIQIKRISKERNPMGRNFARALIWVTLTSEYWNLHQKYCDFVSTTGALVVIAF